MLVWYPGPRIAYVAVPRAGHTSILQQLAAGGLTYGKANKIRKAAAPECFAQARYSFMVVRHPWDRLCSIWRYFLGPGRKRGLPGLAPLPLAALVERIDSHTRRDGWTDLNRHFWPQVKHMGPPNRPFLEQTLFAFDDLGLAWAGIRQGLQDACGLQMPAELLTHRRPSRASEATENSHLRRKAERIYANDLELWRAAKRNTGLYRLRSEGGGRL